MNSSIVLEIFAESGLRLHKFVSNSVDVMESVDPNDRAKGVKELDLLNDVLPRESSRNPVVYCVGLFS